MCNNYSIRAPLVPFYGDSKKNIFLKLENLQPFGSYKIRGVENIIKNLTVTQLKNGLVAASAGNMGQAVAFLAKKHNIPCTIIVPDSAPLIKLENIKNLGASVINLPYKQVWEIVQNGKYPDHPGYFIHPANNELLTDGYGSIAKEIIKDFPNVDSIIIPFGVGGLSIGIASYIKKYHSRIKIYTVEPETSHPLFRLLKNNDTKLNTVNKSIVDAIGTPEVIKSVRKKIVELIDSPTIVSINDTKDAIASLYHKHHIVVEGAGATSLASALSDQVKEKNIVCIISGGNIDFNNLVEIICKNI